MRVRGLESCVANDAAGVGAAGHGGQDRQCELVLHSEAAPIRDIAVDAASRLDLRDPGNESADPIGPGAAATDDLDRNSSVADGVGGVRQLP